MPNEKDALPEIMRELTDTHHLAMTPATEAMCRDIFDRTVGNFARQATAKGAAQHPWENEDFRAFILGQVARIAESAGSKAGSEPVSPDVFRQAAVEVMRRTQRVCRVAAERGKLKFKTSEVAPEHEGEVCSIYLSDPDAQGALMPE